MLSALIDHQPAPVQKSLITFFDVHHLFWHHPIFGINFLIYFVSLILTRFFLIYFFMHKSDHDLHSHHSNNSSLLDITKKNTTWAYERSLSASSHISCSLPF